MTNYTILKTENLPEPLKNKPKWMLCVIFTAALITMIVSAVSVGVFIGYTYCYVEHRTGFNTGNVTNLTDIRLSQVSYKNSPEDAYKRTINGATSFLISNIMKMSHNLWEAEWNVTPTAGRQRNITS